MTQEVSSRHDHQSSSWLQNAPHLLQSNWFEDEIRRKGNGQGIEGAIGEGQRLSPASAKGDR